MFKNKTIWITGASSGIGEALAYAFAQHGARLILSARNVDKLAKVKEQCLQYGGEAIVQPLDLSDFDRIPQKINPILEMYPKIDILVNNGGISQRGLVQETKLEVTKRILDVNFLGQVAMTKAVLPTMLSHKLGHIVVISSVVGKFGTPRRSSYSASKHALHGFFDALRAELVDDNIKVTLICPGYIRTNISYNALNPNGDKHAQLDPGQAAGMSAEKFAKKVLKVIKKQKREAYIGGAKEIFGIYLKRFFPGFFARFIARTKVT